MLATVLSACKFESDIEPLRFPTAPPQPSFGFAPEAVDPFESPDEAVSRLLDELFDPYNLPGDQTYEGSVYQRMDQIIAGAYAYYGYDLAAVAAKKQNNPLTDQLLLNYLSAEGPMYVTDPVSGREFSTYEWLQISIVSAGGGASILALEAIGGVNLTNPLNYERNYLAALFAQYPWHVAQARIGFRRDLYWYYGEDAAAIFEYLGSLDQFDVE